MLQNEEASRVVPVYGRRRFVVGWLRAVGCPWEPSTIHVAGPSALWHDAVNCPSLLQASLLVTVRMVPLENQAASFLSFLGLFALLTTINRYCEMPQCPCLSARLARSRAATASDVVAHVESTHHPLLCSSEVRSHKVLAFGTWCSELQSLRPPSSLVLQDVQLTIGSEHRMGVAVWLPSDLQPWQDHQHYILSCDWAVLALSPAPVPMSGWSSATGSDAISTTAATALSAMATVLSLAAVFVSIVVGWWVRSNARQFENIEGL